MAKAKAKRKRRGIKPPEEVIEEIERFGKAAGWSNTVAHRACLQFGLAVYALASLRAEYSTMAKRPYIGREYILKQQAAQAIIPALPTEVLEEIKRTTGVELEPTVEDFEVLIAWTMIGLD